MKKVTIIIITMILLVGSLVWGAAWDNLMYGTSSGEKTSDTAVVAQECFLIGVLVITDGTNDATVILYDDPDSADGTKLWEIVVTGSDNYGGGLFPYPIRASTGIYADLTGTGASVIVYYRLIDAKYKQPI